MRRLLLAFAAVCALTGVAHADPTRLANVPTADIRERGTVYVGVGQELYRDQDEQEDDKRTNIYTSIGLLDRLEAGIDVNNVTQDADLEGDVKWQFLDPNTNRFGVAVGAYNIGGDDDLIDGDLVGYGVATGREGAASFTLGVGASEETVGVLFGGSYALNERWSAFVDYDDAQDLGRASFGAAYQPREGLLARAYYTDGEDDLQVIRLELAVVGRVLGI